MNEQLAAHLAGALLLQAASGQGALPFSLPSVSHYCRAVDSDGSYWRKAGAVVKGAFDV